MLMVEIKRAETFIGEVRQLLNQRLPRADPVDRWQLQLVVSRPVWQPQVELRHVGVEGLQLGTARPGAVNCRVNTRSQSKLLLACCTVQLWHLNAELSKWTNDTSPHMNSIWAGIQSERHLALKACPTSGGWCPGFCGLVWKSSEHLELQHAVEQRSVKEGRNSLVTKSKYLPTCNCEIITLLCWCISGVKLMSDDLYWSKRNVT